MKRIVEEAIARAGLSPVLIARRAGDLSAVRTLLIEAGAVDLLALGALADFIRASESGDEVRVHPALSEDVLWIEVDEPHASELDVLRAVATARVTNPAGTHVGVDWGRIGLELAQVALGFGATDLTGPITRKSGTLIAAEDLRKVKGQGMVAETALKRREIAALIRNAGRSCLFTDDEASHALPPAAEAVHA